MQSIESITCNSLCDYIGPLPKTDIGKYKNINLLTILNLTKHKRIIDIVNGSFSRYYHGWCKCIKNIKWEEYYALHLEFSRWPFVLEEAHKHNVPVFIRIHNVEHDYFYNIYKNNNTISNYLRYLHFSNAEKKCVKMAEKLICLTEADKERLIELYGSSVNNKIVVNPVCIDNDCEKYPSSKEKYFLITGSLKYGPNLAGIEWFINKVWIPLYESDPQLKKFQLFVAGSKPSPELVAICNTKKGIKLIDSPDDIDEYFKKAYCYVSPIFNGAGMKVKIGQALMYWLPIITTPHCKIGYEKASDIIIASNEIEMKDAIKNIISLKKEDYIKLSTSNHQAYVDYFSMEHSIKVYKRLIKTDDLN